MSTPPATSGGDRGEDDQSCHIAVPNRYSELRRVSEWVHQFAQKRGLTHPIAYGLDLAVNEALTNIISYAYGDDRPHEISVALNAQPSQVRVEVQDDGVPFNPLELPIEPPQIDLDKSRRTGRGIPLMRNFMDELHYARRDTRNVLVMVLLMPPG